MVTTEPGTTLVSRSNIPHVLTFSFAQHVETGSVHHLVVSEHLSKEDERWGFIIVPHLGEVCKRAHYNLHVVTLLISNFESDMFWGHIHLSGAYSTHVKPQLL